MKAFFYCAMLFALALPSYAAEGTEGVLVSSSGSDSTSRDTLERFNLAPKYLEPDDDNALRDELGLELRNHCETSSPLKCLNYLRDNPGSVQQVVPNNPEFWQTFDAVLTGPSFAPLSSNPALDGPRSSTYEFIDASQDWLYKTIIETNGQVDVTQFVTNYKNYRRFMAQSHTLIDRMVFTALVGIAHQQSEMMMALYAEQGDLASLKLLRNALTPFSQNENSLRLTFVGEAQYIQNQFKLELPSTKELSKAEREEQKAQVQETIRTEWDLLIEFVGEVSERDWDGYWGQGIDATVIEQIRNESPFSPSFSDYLIYLATTRSLEVMVHPLQAMSDIYLGHASPGIPARLAPAYWGWRWDNKTNQLCLVPTQVLPDKTVFSIEHPACVTYLKP